MRLIDLRSDTVTRPSPGMRAAMAAAEVGDDVYGEDPTINRLETAIAALLGKEAAVFVPTGTMANQIALGAHLAPGEEVILDAGAHCLNYEAGALAALWGAQPMALSTPRGIFTAADVERAIRPANDHLPRTALVEMENTHNRGGGTVWPLGQMREVSELAKRRGLKVHLDGARLFNAQTASGVAAREFAACADTVSTCFSKGLGAPAGSALCGDAATIKRARKLRKRLGGAMRQSGVLAAAALYALENNVERLAEDHANARRLAEGLANVRGLTVDVRAVESNILFAGTAPGEAPGVLTRMREAGVLANAEAARIRLVTHLDVNAADIDEAVARIARVMA